MELQDYLRILRRSWRTVAVIILLGVVLAAVSTALVRPSYTAVTRLFVAAMNSGSVAELQQGNTFTQARVKSYAETATTPLVLQPAIDSLGLDMSAADLAGAVEATADPNTVLLTISARSDSPVEAAAVAQAVADSLISTVQQLERSAEGSVSPVKLSVVTPATAPSKPASPNLGMNLLVGFLVGAAVGISLALLRSKLSTRVRGESDIRRVTDAALLGGLTFDQDAVKKPLLTQVPTQSPRAESFRQIRTNLQFTKVQGKSKTVLITSSLPGEGKSTTSTNLAIAMAQAGQSVVLIDADLRRPRIDEYLGLERNAGLTTALVGKALVEDLLQPWGQDELYVLTAGEIPPNPSELLGSEAMKKLLAELEERFDAVVIDAPPLLPVTDAAVLAQQVGGVVLIIGSSKVKVPDLRKSIEALEMVQAKLLGVVINLLPNSGPDAYEYSYYSSDPQTEAPQLKDHKRLGRRGSSEPYSDFDERVLGKNSGT